MRCSIVECLSKLNDLKNSLWRASQLPYNAKSKYSRVLLKIICFLIFPIYPFKGALTPIPLGGALYTAAWEGLHKQRDLLEDGSLTMEPH